MSLLVAKPVNALAMVGGIVEELVGEIEDEHDVGELRRAERLPDGSILVDGLISINDLEEVLDIKIEEGLPYDTLAGLILAELGRFPEKGEEIRWKDYVLVCEEVTPTSVVRVRIVMSETTE